MGLIYRMLGSERVQVHKSAVIGQTKAKCLEARGYLLRRTQSHTLQSGERGKEIYRKGKIYLSNEASFSPFVLSISFCSPSLLPLLS